MKHQFLGRYFGRVLLSVFLLCVCISTYASDPLELQRALKYVLLPHAQALKPFKLINHKNKSFSLNELKGRWTFIYFGYASCPDVCPMTTDELNTVYKKLTAHPQYKRDTDFVFVSVDPYRDTPELLSDFTGYFGFPLTGVVAPVESINVLTAQLGVFHRRMIVEDRESKNKEYVVEHGADIYLINPDAELVAKFPPPHYGKEIKELYVKIREFFSQPRNSI